MLNSSLKAKPVIGIVGGVGAGKSTVAAQFAAMGCVVVDCDAIGHGLLADEGVRERLRGRWGQAVFGPEGSVDRRALAEKVFRRPEDLQELNRIMHPRIRDRIQEDIRRAWENPSVAAVVIDAAVLFEAGWDDLCSHVVFVRAPEEDRARRARASRGWDTETWRLRENSQFSLDKKARNCDYTVDNSSSASYLSEQVRRTFHRIVCDVECP